MFSNCGLKNRYEYSTDDFSCCRQNGKSKISSASTNAKKEFFCWTSRMLRPLSWQKDIWDLSGRPRKMCVVLLRYRVLPSEPFAVRRDTSNSTENGISLLIWLFRVLHDIKNLRRISQALSSLPNNEMCWAFTVLSHPHLWKMKDLFDFFSSHPNPIKEERNLMIPQWIPQSGNPFVRLVWASYESLLTASWRMSDLFERCLVFSKAKWV